MMIFARFVCWLVGHSYDVHEFEDSGDIYRCRYCPAWFIRYHQVTVTEHRKDQEIGT